MLMSLNNMVKLSEVVAETKKVASRRHVSLEDAAVIALTEKAHVDKRVHYTQSLGVTYIDNDLRLPKELKLHSAVMTALGREGGEQSAINRKQFKLQLLS